MCMWCHLQTLQWRKPFVIVSNDRCSIEKLSKQIESLRCEIQEFILSFSTFEIWLFWWEKGQSLSFVDALLAKAEHRCCCFAEMTTEASQSVCCHLWNKMTLACQLFWKAWLFKLDSLLFNEVWWRFCSVSRSYNSSPKAKELNEEQIRNFLEKNVFIWAIYCSWGFLLYNNLDLIWKSIIGLVWQKKNKLILSPHSDGC